MWEAARNDPARKGLFLFLSFSGRQDAVSEWQPIETAPKVGTIIVAGPGWMATSSTPPSSGLFWTTHPPLSGQRPYDLTSGMSQWPTHWMPLPAPPSVGKGGTR